MATHRDSMAPMIAAVSFGVGAGRAMRAAASRNPSSPNMEVGARLQRKSRKKEEEEEQEDDPPAKKNGKEKLESQLSRSHHPKKQSRLQFF